MKNRYKNHIQFELFDRLMIGTLLLVLPFTSCKKQLEIDPPSNSLTTSSVFTNDASVIAAQLGVYSRICNSQINYELYTGMSADELTNYNTAQLNADLYRNNLNVQSDGGLGSTWSGFYVNIYAENLILENLATAKGVTDKVRQLTTGEAYFGRAYNYFQLVNMFGDVPLILSTDYTKNSTVAHVPKDQVYQQIVADLQMAQGLLSANYLDPSDNQTNDKVRPTTWAADALLARVYLYMGKYDLAEQQASLVISNSTYSLSPISGTNSTFSKNSTEAIWQLTPPTGALYTYEGQYFILLTAPASNSAGKVAISPQLLNAFEANDARRINWIGSYTQGSNTWYFPNKYKATTTSTSLTEFSMVLRLGEQYLIRAEARAQSGKITGANSAESDLNMIRSRAGLPNTAANTQSTMLAAIAHERQVELFTEGHRWFDLKRTNSVDAVMTTVAPTKGGVWKSYQQLYPLPQADLNYDPNLVQNPGY